MKRLWTWLANARRSLLSRYVILIGLAILLIPLALILASASMYWLFPPTPPSGNGTLYQDGAKLESMWRSEALALGGKPDAAIDDRLRQISKQYSKASMFWVDEDSRARFPLPYRGEIKEHWTAADAIAFMRERRDSNPFTIVAFIGGGTDEGFIVFEVPREEMVSANREMQVAYGFPAALLLILALFLAVSWIFFYRIRRRLLRLQQAMASQSGATGIPDQIKVGRLDEIGRLETAFNRMIGQLEESRQRETEEERLRRQLIANLSHDLRSPLTAIRGHAFHLNDEPLSSRGRESVQLIDRKINYLSQLIDNLLSYTLLSSGKYPYRPETIDMTRLIRQLCANWYAAFEQQSIELALVAPERGFRWRIDPQWMERIMDNLLQNIVRHASKGRYAGIRLYEQDGFGIIEVIDRGPGLQGESSEKGAGIGLSIVSHMAKDMRLEWQIASSAEGTICTLRGLNQI